VPAITAIAAGNGHTCAVTNVGGVKCWGSNSYGQLGDGSTTDSLVPVDVSGLASGVSMIAAGGDHNCVLMTAGGVKCWGSNFAGQLGNGSTTDSHTPVAVSSLTSGVTAIAAGGWHTCALSILGVVTCWGDNSAGQLGDGTTVHSSIPVDVAGLGGGVTAIAGGAFHTCALTSVGGVKCWGANGQGQLGNGTVDDKYQGGTGLSPVDVSGLTSGVKAITAGYDHTCALTVGGGIKCWGYKGINDPVGERLTDSLTPDDVAGLTTGAIAVTAGFDHTCALTSEGGVKCWGKSGSGQLGNGTTTASSVPVDVTGLASGVTAIAAGSGHACALTTSGAVTCWGSSGSKVPVEVDFSGNRAPQIPPLTDAVDPGLSGGRSDLPLLPLLAGLAAGIVTATRRRADAGIKRAGRPS
jgi:alpha-tubulin suppressor-like RCC1 family protein